MWRLVLPALLFTTLALAQDPPVSPSLEADADHLLAGGDFLDAQFGMRIEAVGTRGNLVVRTTGAQFTFDAGRSQLTVRQLLGREREAVRVSFPAGTLEGLRIARQGTGAVLLRKAGGDLQLRLNADSLLMLKSRQPLALQWEVAFRPASVRRMNGDRLLADEWGFVGEYFATGEGKAVEGAGSGSLQCSLAAGQVWWLAVGPPRPYPWEQSLSDRVAWHWSMDTGYPTDAQIKQWSAHSNILLQQSEVMLWKDWSLRFIPRNGPEEFERVNRTCERSGMRNIVYTSPLYFLAGTGLESKAMNSFDNFAVTGFSPGDGRGLNWPIFLSQITRVVHEYKPDGLYFDGIYDSVVRTYLISRKSRELVGDGGILEYHATGSPPGGGCYLPQIDTYYSFILRGEGCEANYSDPDYLRYFVSTYNLSNSIGVLCNNNAYVLDEKFVGTLLDNNIRLHYLPGGTEQAKQAMSQYYWPALKPELRQRVEAVQEARQEHFLQAREEYEKLFHSRMPDLPVIWQEQFRDPALALSLPQPAPEKGLEQALPGGWLAYLSPRGEGKLAAGDGSLQLGARAHTTAWLQRDLPPETAAVECRVAAEGDFGMSWGPALLLRVGGAVAARVGLRSDGRLQTDRAGQQSLYPGYRPGDWCLLRVRIVGHYVVAEARREGSDWEVLRVDWLPDPSAAKQLMIGKVPYDGGRTDHTECGDVGKCRLADLKVYGGAASR